jgi:hypothetical protein
MLSMPAASPREAMIDEAVRRAPSWAQQHLVETLLIPSDAPCERCDAALEAIRAAYRRLVAKAFSETSGLAAKSG